MASIPPSSLLGDSSEWENAPLDVDLDDSAAGEGSMAMAGGDSEVSASPSTGARTQGHFATFVKESEEIELLLLQLPYPQTPVSRLCDIFDLYQEQCELLDPHLPHAVTTLMNYVHAIIRPGKSTPVPPANSTTGAIVLGASPVPSAAASFKPDGQRCSDTELIVRVFKVIYSLAKVRGYKTIVHFFPHEVADLEPTLSLLHQQNRESHENWETRYGLLLWLSIIVLIPFDLTTVDSSVSQVQQQNASQGNAPVGIISNLISLGESYLADTGPPREAAAVMLSKLFSRVDMHGSHLANFLVWCSAELNRIHGEQQGKAASSKNVFLQTGIFRSLVEIFRHAPREVLLKHVNLVYAPILTKHEQWSKSSNTLLRKLFVKLSQRVGLVYLPARVAQWRYQRGHRSLLNTLQQSGATRSSAAAFNPLLGSSHHIQHTSAVAEAAESKEDDADEEEVPSEIEDIIQILLDGLRDRDTVVRWSSAKGIGRLTNCLPADFGDDVVGSVLDLFSGRESDGAWHGGCLALAELARRGLLLPARLGEVVPITLKALVYDQRTATHSVGAHVRDAACYVIWAFARAYAPEVMTSYMQNLAQGLLTLCVFDREVNVRRASSAAFQEHVGRQGSASFPHGMAILQIADYFTVSNRQHAYTVVSWEIAKYEEYTVHLIEHLLTFKVKHWEKEIRVLTAKTLGILTKRNEVSRKFTQEVVLPSLLQLAVKSTDLVEKHGSVLAIGEIILSLYELSGQKNDYLSAEVKLQVCGVINHLTGASSNQLLNGRGGQIMRESICDLISSIAQVGLLYTDASTLSYLRPYQAILDENLAHTNEEVQSAAIRAVEQFIRAYYLPRDSDDAKAKADKLARAKPVVDHYTRTLGHPSSLAGTTRGFAAALGTIPQALLTTTQVRALEVYSAVPAAAATGASSSASTASTTPPADALIFQPMSRILQTLILSCNECGQGDAETRRNAVQSLEKLITTLSEQDLLSYMTPMPQPPPPPATPAVPTASSSAPLSAAASAAKEKELKAQQKLIKLQQESIQKYWNRDLVELGIAGNRVFERVATALLIALDDYATDNRGDVGSWVREAAMSALEILLLKLSRMSSNAALQFQYPAVLSEKTFPALLKQSVEKIDRVREKSGQIFHRLLWASQPEISAIPLKEELRNRFPLAGNAAVASSSDATGSAVNSVDWSSPSQTFPLLVPIMALSSTSASGTAVFPYHRNLLSGLFISVGGLTESVVKSSSESFIEYVSQHSSNISEENEESAHSLQLIKLLASDILYILNLEKGHARVIVPAFKTLELLLSQSLLECLTLEISPFASDLQSRVWKEISKSQNIHKLMSGIPVLVGLLSYQPLRSQCFQHLLTLLGHATFPKIRRLTGESLYNALLIADDWIPGAEEDPEKSETILNILTNTPWDGPVQQARAERDKLYPLLQVEKPKLKAEGAKKGSTAAGSSALSPSGDISALSNEYSSLVRTLGY